jgi:hypothetical protein
MYGNGSGNGLTGAAAQRTGGREFFFNNLSVTALKAGDYDSDGDVDGGDFLVWQRELKSTANSPADGNRDGVVNFADLQVWKSGFASASEMATTGIPEPGLIALLLMPCWLALRRRSA